MIKASDTSISFYTEGDILYLAGDWVVTSLDHVEKKLLDTKAGKPSTISLEKVSSMDVSGVWFINKLKQKYNAKITHIHDENIALFEYVESQSTSKPPKTKSSFWQSNLIAQLGETSYNSYKEVQKIISFLGYVFIYIIASIKNPSRIRTKPLIYHIQHVGIHSLFIVGLTTLLIGVVIAYMGSIQLKKFQAEVFTLDLVAISMLREIGIILASIMLAGRSGSAFTAQIGTMKINDEIDAMRTMGIDPMDSLVIPRVFAIVIVMPLLTFYADIMGLIGGAVMGLFYLDLGLPEILYHYQRSITDWHFWTGMIKAPIFGFVIAVIGCYQGLRVKYNAESIGSNTTTSVVRSIFLIIILDAFFAIFYGEVGI